MKPINIEIIILLLFAYLQSSLQFNIGVEYFKNKLENNGTQFYRLDFIGLSESHGRRAEMHNVTTEDGYILTLFRIPPNPAVNNPNTNRPIFLHHGLLATADIFILFGNGRSLAYTLSDAGYDVWMGNLRGTHYSREHQKFTTADPEFWDFSMDEYATKDLPAFFDYILEWTNRPTLSFIGHSLGTTTILILLSDKPQYNAKLDLVVHFAPVSYWKGWNLTRKLMAIVSLFLEIMFPGGRLEYPPKTPAALATKSLCNLNQFTKDLCQIPVDLALGKDREQFDEDDAMKTSPYYPAGTSAKAIQHYGQHVRSGRFRHYDYGAPHLNIKKYGSIIPPEYKVSNIRTPTMIFRGKNDPISTEAMNRELIRRLSKDVIVTNILLEYEKFNHSDFISAKDVQKLFFDRMLKILEEFFNKMV